MAVEYLFAIVVSLLPVAALSGWYVGRRDSNRKNLTGKPLGLSPDYFRGLNYLLDDRPDKAIEVFIKVLEVEKETVETHLALGTLFRRRGEVDRAIRIHQNIVARPSLEFDQRTTALLELGLDYMRSGLLDRAESLFKELLETGAHQRQAISHLIDIYQQEREWEKALEYARRLEELANRSLGDRRAHFLCEQAAALIEAGEVEPASDKLREAQRVDESCVRASLMQARLAMTAGAYEAAIGHLRRIETQDLAFIGEAITPLSESYRALGRENELEQYLQHLCSRRAGISAVLALCEIMVSKGHISDARQVLVNELKQRPSVHGIDRLVDYSIADGDDGLRGNLSLLKELTGKLLGEHTGYSCGHCGFQGRVLHWQCPSCQSWNSVKPRLGIEGD